MLMAARKLQRIGLLALVTVCALLAWSISLPVSSTRSELRRVEAEVAATRARIRTVEGEIAVLANLSQLERWNVETYGYTAPVAGQYLSGERELATLDRLGPARGTPGSAPLVLALRQNGDRASADAPTAARRPNPVAERVASDAMRDLARVAPASTPITTMAAAR